MTARPAFSIPVGSLSLEIPAGRAQVPGLLWGNLALAGLMESHGYTDVAKDTLTKLEGWLQGERLAELAWPGEQEKRVGRRLLDGVQPGDGDLSWYVVRAATRQEKRAEEGLIEAGFPVYLPRLIRWRRNRRTKTKIEGALLPGYMFVGCRSRVLDRDAHDADMNAIAEIEFVHAVVRSSALRAPQPAPFLGNMGVYSILQQELDGEFDKTLRRKRRPDPNPDDPVRVLYGSFSAFPAKFVERTENDRVKVLMHMFGRWVSMTYDANDIEGMGEEG